MFHVSLSGKYLHTFSQSFTHEDDAFNFAIGVRKSIKQAGIKVLLWRGSVIIERM